MIIVADMDLLGVDCLMKTLRMCMYVFSFARLGYVHFLLMMSVRERAETP